MHRKSASETAAEIYNNLGSVHNSSMIQICEFVLNKLIESAGESDLINTKYIKRVIKKLNDQLAAEENFAYGKGKDNA